MARKSTDKTTKTVSPEKTTPPQAAQAENADIRKQPYAISRWFWGGLFIVVGGLFLLGNLGIIELNVAGMAKLWPLLVVLAGVSIIALTSKWWQWIAGILAIASLTLIIVVGTGSWGKDTNADTSNVRTVAIDREQDVTRASIRLSAGAGKIRLGSENISDVATAGITGDGASITHTSNMSGSVQHVDLSTSAGRDLFTVPRPHGFKTVLTESLPLTLDLEIGAAKLDADLSGVLLDTFTLNIGASDADIRLGSRQDESAVTVKAGASDITIQVPRDSGVEVRTDTGLSNIDLDEFEPSDGGDFYVTDNFDDAEKKITITLHGGVANFSVERY